MNDLATYLIIGIIPFFLLLDAFRGARKYEAPRWWRLRGLLVTGAAFWLSGMVAAFWAGLLGDYTLFDLSGLGIGAGALVGILVYELVHYWYHRAIHRYDFLWRLTHQMHHSTEKLDAFGAYYLHPLDVFFFTTWSSLVLVPLLGLATGAVLICAAFLTFNAMFQHANIRTPRWLGYIIQRPESHVVHHSRGMHHYNYADLPLLDMLFGTFRNPENVDGLRVGFYNGASTRLFDQILFQDVSEPEPEAAVADCGR